MTPTRITKRSVILLWPFLSIGVGVCSCLATKQWVNKTTASFSSCFRGQEVRLVMNFKGRRKNTFNRKWKRFGPLAFVLQGSMIHIFLAFIPCYFWSVVFFHSATTHTDLVLRAHQLNIPYQVIHNASIMNAVGCCGLQVRGPRGISTSKTMWTDHPPLP